MDPIRVEFRRDVRSTAEVVWRALSNTDAFNRLAGFGFEFGEDAQPDGSVRRWGRVRRFGQVLEWEERPFQFVAPAEFESARVFRSGPVDTVKAKFRLAESSRTTTVHYTVEILPRHWIARPVIAADTHLNTVGPIEKALDTLVRVIEEDRSDFDPPPPLEDWGEANLTSGLAGVVERDVARALDHIVRNAPLATQARIQPLRLAEQLELPSQTVLEGCLQAVAGGALEARFLLLCPICLGAKEELAALDFSRRSVHCPSCNIGYDGALVDNVEVAFRPSDRVRDFDVPVDCIQSPARTPHVLLQRVLAVGDSAEVEVALTAGCHRLEATPARGALHIEVGPHGVSSVVVDITERGAFPRRVVVGEGVVRLFVRNRLSTPCTVSLAERWRPPYVMTVSAFLENGLASRWAYENQGVMGAPSDGFAIVVGLESPWTRGVDQTQVPQIEAELARLKVGHCQVANGQVVAIVDDLEHALRVVERVSGEQRSVALAAGGVVALEGQFGEAVVGTAVDRAMTVSRAIGWGRTAVDPSLAESARFARTLQGFRGRMEVVEGWGARPALLRFTELAARGHVVYAEARSRKDEPGATAATGREPSRTIGPFTLGDQLGKGGMGAVYRAEHQQSGEAVVIKVLHEKYAQNFKYAAAFYQEARLGWAVHHPRVVRVLDWGIDVERRVLFMVMAPIEGEPLLKVLQREGRIRGDALVDLASGVLDALAAIHDAGVLHRDLKPGNVLVTADGPVLIDFGIALPIDGQRAAVAGTPSYMSPEQSYGRPLDERSDLYQLAVLLCHIGTAQWPFPGDTSLDRLKWRDSHAVETLPGGLPAVLEPVLLKALALDPAERYPSARAMKAAFVS
ncbi:MAG: protein kinase [Myxococcota bacterium]